MEIAVVGGTGMLGRRVVEELVTRGHAVRALSRRAPERVPAGAEHRSVDLTSGSGLGEALAGADAVVDAANSAGRRAAAVLVEGTTRLVEAAASEGVGHIVEISIVGIDAVPPGYYKVKLEQERVIERGDLPWSIVRATQFHELLDRVFSATARFGLVPSARFGLAPVDPRVVAHVLADAIEGGPGGRVAEVRGPQAQPLSELARAWVTANGRHAARVPLPLRRRMREPLAAGALVPSDGAISDGPGFAQWLRLRSGAAGGANAAPLARPAR